MRKRTGRRVFLRNVAAGGAGVLVLTAGPVARTYAANEKLDVALIGIGGRGRWFVDTMPRMTNVVAFCDIDERKFAATSQHYAELAAKLAKSEQSWEKQAAPVYQRLAEKKLPTFADFRKMLDEMGKGIDAVVVATPDHTHAVASAAAIKAGKGVLCEKPLTRQVGESRALRELARRHKVATSMGNQGTASGQFRRALELIRDGALGPIQEVHVWNTGGGADRKEPPKGAPPVPEGLSWDLWLGPARQRAFHPEWMKRNLWRDFGTCQLGNWASHTANLAFMALKVHELWLGEPPAGGAAPRLTVEAKCSAVNRLSFPRWETITWKVPARADLPAVPITWHNGGAPGAWEAVRPLLQEGSGYDEANKRLPFAGAVIVGTKGRIHTTGHNATFVLLPEADFQGVETKEPKRVDHSRGHEMDWVLACKGGKPAWANFDYASALNEFLMLGNVATQFLGPLEYDPRAGKIANNPEADAALMSPYREGWAL